MKIKKQLEPNYTQSRNGGTEFSEVIFELTDGRLFKGIRTATNSPKTSRGKFMTWLKGESEDKHEFVEIESVKWDYSATHVVGYNSDGQRVS